MISQSAWVAMPMGLLYLAAVLEAKGHSVKIIDMEVFRLTDSEFKKILEKENPFLIGLTATTPVIHKAVELCDIAKAVNKGIKTLLGGPHPTQLPEETLAHGAVDMVVSGEGEKTICEILDLWPKGPEKLGQVRGIYFKKGGKTVFTGSREFIPDLDTLPFPAWHLIDMSLYHHPLVHSTRMASVLTSRGCPFRCSFCTRGVFSQKHRQRSVQNVIAEIETLIEKYQIEEIHFVDDNLTLNRSYTEELCRALIRKNWKLKWATPNGVHIHTLDENLLHLIKDAGCYRLSFGLESGNPETLKLIHKQQNLDETREVFRLCRKIGIETTAFAIIGFPNEGRREIDHTLKFLKEIKADLANFHMLIPLPGTEIYRELDAKGYILDRDWSRFVFHNHPPYRTDHLSPEEIFREYKRAYRLYHMRPAYIFSRLVRIKSWQQFKNHVKGFATLLEMRN